MDQVTRHKSGGGIAVDFQEAKIDAIFRELDQCRLPGAAVGIAIGGRPVYRKGFGLANMELPTLLSSGMRMRIYSTSKHFACFAYMLLCEEGKAAIDDPLGKYLPELHPVTHQVTMRQLMSNSSGLRDVHDIRWQFSCKECPVATADLVAFYRDMDDVNFAPGTGWLYNNGGFVLLSVVIERIAGQSLEDVLRTRVFEPVGMHDTLLRRYDSDFVPNSATMHMTTSEGGFDRSYTAGALAGEGGVVSTVDDLLRWLRHMDAPLVGNSATWAAMKAPQRLANGTSTGYALGLVAGRYRGVDTLYHAGGARGSNSQILKVPAAGLDVAVLVNRHDVVSGLLANRILDACLPGLEAVRAGTPLTPVTGTFQSPSTGRVLQLSAASPLAFNEGAEQIVSIDGAEMAFESDEAGGLRPAGLASSMKWAVTLIGDRRAPTKIRFDDYGTPDELVAVTPPREPGLERVVGHFRSGTTGTSIVISGDPTPADQARARMKCFGRFGSTVFDLECLGPNLWRAKSASTTTPGGTLRFDPDGQAFRYSTFCNRSLRFERGSLPSLDRV